MYQHASHPFVQTLRNVCYCITIHHWVLHKSPGHVVRQHSKCDEKVFWGHPCILDIHYHLPLWCKITFSNNLILKMYIPKILWYYIKYLLTDVWLNISICSIWFALLANSKTTDKPLVGCLLKHCIEWEACADRDKSVRSTVIINLHFFSFVKPWI